MKTNLIKYKNGCKFIALLFVSFMLLSCAQKAPYEVRSPCISKNSDNIWYMNPCVRRPANRAIG
jgi:hypothetical protein